MAQAPHDDAAARKPGRMWRTGAGRPRAPQAAPGGHARPHASSAAGDGERPRHVTQAQGDIAATGHVREKTSAWDLEDLRRNDDFHPNAIRSFFFLVSGTYEDIYTRFLFFLYIFLSLQ